MSSPNVRRWVIYLTRLIKETRNDRHAIKSIIPEKRQPLTGVRILDLTHVWSGPHATRLLADWGAEIIHVENSSRMDISRGWLRKLRMYNIMPNTLQLNRNKRCITLSLKEQGGIDIFKDLVKISDVVIENMRPGSMKKLGLDYDVLREIKSDVIMISMSGFGASGSYDFYRAYGATLEGLSGVQSLTSYEKNGRTMRIKELDMLNGLAGASAVMTALIYRQKTGKGQWIDLSQLETSMTGLIGEHLLEYSMNKHQTLPAGNRHPWFAPHGCYPCKGEDKWVTIAIRSDAEWHRFCHATGHEEWINDYRFSTYTNRRLNHDELDVLIASWTTQYSHYDVMRQLQREGIAAGAVLNIAEVCSDQHVVERGFVRKVRDYMNGGLKFPGVPFRYASGNGCISWRGPGLGDDNRYVLNELLNRTDSDLFIMRANKIGTAFDLEKDER